MLLTISILSFAFIESACSQVDTLPEFPSSREVEPTVVTSLEETNGLLRFAYSVTNGQNASQNIWIFLVEISAGEFVNVGPVEWRSSNIRRDTIRAASWGALDTAAMIPPGGILHGFTISANSIPVITSYYAAGYREPPEGEFDYRPGSNDIFYNSVKGRTIGPANLPVAVDPVVFVDTLMSYKHHAFNLGWIRGEGIVKSLDAKLEAARVQIIKNRPSAKNILQAFVNELEALNTKGNQITSEAYALLKFNALYLISKL